MATELEQGIELFKKGNAAGAVAHLEAALEQNPQDYCACQYLGAAYQSLGRYDKAVDPMRKAALLQPNLAQARYNLGLALEHASQPGEAASEMMQALALKPDYARAQEALARLRPAEPSQAPSPFAPFGGTLIAAPVNPLGSGPANVGSGLPHSGPLNAQPQEEPVMVGQAPGYSSPLPTAYGPNSGFPPLGGFPPAQGPGGNPTLNQSKPAPAHGRFSGDSGVKWGLSGGVGIVIAIRVVFIILRVMSNHQDQPEASGPQYAGAYRSAPIQTQDSTQDALDAFRRNQAVLAQQQQQRNASVAAMNQTQANQMQATQAQNQQANIQTQQNMQAMQQQQMQAQQQQMQNMQQMQQQNMQRMGGAAGPSAMPGRMGSGFGR